MIEHLAAVVKLPFHHRDPFDRLLIAQAMVEQIPIVGADGSFDVYPIERLYLTTNKKTPKIKHLFL
jgi:PIN domain nuclease of toxin-antitoxin system